MMLGGYVQVWKNKRAVFKETEKITEKPFVGLGYLHCTVTVGTGHHLY